MTDNITLDSAKIQLWIAGKLDAKKIQEELLTHGYDAVTIDAYLQEFNRIKLAKRQGIAFVFLTVGAILGFISCILSLTNPVPALYYLVLYGLTSLSVVIVFIGLYYLFE